MAIEHPNSADGGRMIACKRPLNWNAQPPYCNAEAVVMTASACRHEHLSAFEPFCADCRKTLDNETWLCASCLHGREPHNCPVAMIDRPLA